MTRDADAYSWPLLVSDVPAGGRSYRLQLTEADRARVAAMLGLPRIERLEATLRAVPFGRDGVAVSGSIAARLTQVCVVSLDEFDADIEAPVDIRFSPDGRDPNAGFDLAELTDLGAEDPPDLLTGNRIDLGAIVAEFLALALDPYPRKSGVAFEAGPDEEGASPFAALKALKPRD